MAKCYLQSQLYLISNQVNERVQLQLVLFHKKTIEQHQIKICREAPAESSHSAASWLMRKQKHCQASLPYKF